MSETVLVAHVQIRRMLKRVPKLSDKVIGQDLLDLGMIRKPSNDLNRPLHNHRLVILLRLALDLCRDDLKQSLDI